MPTSQQPVPSSHKKEPAGQVLLCRTNRPRALVPNPFLPVLSAATKPAWRTSNAETKIFDNISKEYGEIERRRIMLVMSGCWACTWNYAVKLWEGGI